MVWDWTVNVSTECEVGAKREAVIQPISRWSCSFENTSGSMGISQSTNATLMLGGLPKPKLYDGMHHKKFKI